MRQHAQQAAAGGTIGDIAWSNAPTCAFLHHDLGAGKGYGRVQRLRMRSHHKKGWKQDGARHDSGRTISRRSVWVWSQNLKTAAAAWNSKMGWRWVAALPAMWGESMGWAGHVGRVEEGKEAYAGWEGGTFWGSGVGKRH